MTLMACVSRSLLLLAVLGVVSAQIACNYKPPGFDATFDLSELHRPDTNAGYRVLDHERDVRNYTYVFNICGVAKPTTPCNFTSSAPAYQLGNEVAGEYTSCWRLGGDLVQDMHWELIDGQDPSKGVKLVYSNGDQCSDGSNRTLTIQFGCSAAVEQLADSEVIENTACNYTIVFNSIFGCPNECQLHNLDLCGGHGFCGLDSSTNSPRCFCNDGHYGSDCTALSSPSPSSSSSCSGICVVLIFVFIILVGLSIAAAVLWWQLNKAQKLNVRFNALSDSFLTKGGPNGTGASKGLMSDDDDRDEFNVDEFDDGDLADDAELPTLAVRED